MERLRRTVSEALEKQLSCQIPDDEIRRIWPNDSDRHYQLARFANENQWLLLSYTQDEGAIFYRRN